MIDNIKDQTVAQWLALIMPNERIFWLYLLSSAIIAWLSWLYYRRLGDDKKPEGVERTFLSYLFDKRVYLHRSAVQDYIYFFLNGLIYSGIVAQLLISTHFFMMLFHTGFESAFGMRDSGLVTPSLWTLALYTLVYAVFLDFAIFITHYAQHKIPILWEFHKVHHSAEVLTPVTLYRMHPVDLLFSGFVASLLAGLAFAGYYYLTGKTPEPLEAMGMNLVVFVFYLLGYNLRHSQIWLNYPGWLSHIFISPAQHQIHHSTEPKHFDKNMGLLFAFWDKFFGTLYVPKAYEKITYGINKKEPNPFKSVAAMYLQPFKGAWGLLARGEKGRERAFVAVLVLLFFTANYGVFLALDQTMTAQNRPLPSVQLEDLTWTEVRRAIDERGYDTLIVPTGGTEQNGPHVILGKHNVIIRHNAEEIAKKLGGALVAPVIAYVPEDVHMPWAGTISVPESVLEGLLEGAAESAITHGFKHVFFIGESGGNQIAQQKIAAKMSAQWSEKGIVIAHIGDYYSANGQMAWLLSRGYTEKQIGGHAGIRDTSEIMYLHPEGLRRDPWIIPDTNAGYNGEPSLARKRIGKIMTALKIEAALKQIRPLLHRDENKAEDASESIPKRPVI